MIVSEMTIDFTRLICYLMATCANPEGWMFF